MKRKPNFPNFPPGAGITEEDCLLTSRDVARLFALNPGTVKAWRSRNKRRDTGPEFIRVGGLRVRYSFRAVREYLAQHTTARRPTAPFYRRTKIEELDAKHPGLRKFVEERQRRRVSNRVIAAEVLERWGETVSGQVLHNFYALRVWPKELREEREG